MTVGTDGDRDAADGVDAGGIAAPYQIEVLYRGPAVTQDASTRAVIACDPGVQSGYALAIRHAGEVVALATWLVGLRRVEGRRGRPMQPARPPAARDHALIITKALTILRAVIAPAPGVDELTPVLVAEDWFAGVNPGTARDIAQQFYFAEAAAQRSGLVFRAVGNQTWKKTYLGRGNMRKDEALVAYAARGHEAHPQVERWAGQTASALTEADDAAALGVAHHWLETEAT